MKKSVSKGFTLIELLVVIAIIGILASIVLVNLNTARTKGQDAKVKSEIANSRAAAELGFTGDSYEGVCDTGGELAAILTSLLDTSGTGNADCADNDDGWAITARLSDNTTWVCTDATGAVVDNLTADTITNGTGSGGDVDCAP